MRRFALPGVLQDAAAPNTVGHSPLLDLLQGSETPEAGIIIAQAAISDAGGQGEFVDVSHGHEVSSGTLDLITAKWGNPRFASQ